MIGLLTARSAVAWDAKTGAKPAEAQRDAYPTQAKPKAQTASSENDFRLARPNQVYLTRVQCWT